MKILLLSTYELGRQPFGLASPAAWLRKRGHQVSVQDLSREPLREDLVRDARMIALYVPMHTATRLALQLVEPLRRLNPHAHLCAYGLYASLAAESFRAAGVTSLIAGEFEQGLVDVAERIGGPSAAPQIHPLDSNVSLARLKFLTPERTGLPPLDQYAKLVLPSGEEQVAGYTEATRGCKHHCRHCPIVPVYDGAFRLVDRDVVLADVRQQVAAGARHLTFGDPDFFNATAHVIPLVEALHREFPALTYDVTIKVEHLLKHADLLPVLKNTGCLFVISAVESLDDKVLALLQKGHTREDFFRAVELCRQAGLALHPTFLPFTPWTTRRSYMDLLEQLLRLQLSDAVSPIQLAIRLLVPAGSKLLELQEMKSLLGPFDAQALVYPWKHPDPAIDKLCEQLQLIIAATEKAHAPRNVVFDRILRAAHHCLETGVNLPQLPILPSRATVPYLNEPWYC